MSPQFVRMAADIVIANSTGRGFTSEQIIEMLKSVADTLKEMSAESGEILAVVRPSPEAAPIQDWKSSIGKDSITCMICGHTGKVLAQHLKRAHKMTSREYRKQFSMPTRTPLASKTYSAKRRKIAKHTGIGEKLQKAREAKKAASKS